MTADTYVTLFASRDQEIADRLEALGRGAAGRSGDGPMAETALVTSANT